MSDCRPVAAGRRLGSVERTDGRIRSRTVGARSRSFVRGDLNGPRASRQLCERVRMNPEPPLPMPDTHEHFVRRASNATQRTAARCDAQRSGRFEGSNVCVPLRCRMLLDGVAPAHSEAHAERVFYE